MRIFAACLVAAAFGFVAPAAAQPTGYQIKGCTHYYMVGSRVVQVCDPRSPSSPLFWETVVNGGGGEPGSGI